MVEGGCAGLLDLGAKGAADFGVKGRVAGEPPGQWVAVVEEEIEDAVDCWVWGGVGGGHGAAKGWGE